MPWKLLAAVLVKPLVCDVMVRMKQRITADKFRINGIELAPAERTIEWGKRIVDMRAEATVQAIRKAMTANP